ncbi:hypothetical protein AC578_4674 [Pseudocercospora eumusae]|uniref:Ubiquitin-like protease family profile domain-containing protein n=1 Tax=Pseudocercospora eumusae TaxID=321146 RepID=A0A139H7D1_9PEZI|nr:hypothetical protein AC578_4674 [Pseudocercospora eumusae]
MDAAWMAQAALGTLVIAVLMTWVMIQVHCATLSFIRDESDFVPHEQDAAPSETDSPSSSSSSTSANTIRILLHDIRLDTPISQSPSRVTSEASGGNHTTRFHGISNASSSSLEPTSTRRSFGTCFPFPGRIVTLDSSNIQARIQGQTPDTVIVGTLDGQDLLQRDLLRLCPPGLVSTPTAALKSREQHWLNDAVVNAFMVAVERSDINRRIVILNCGWYHETLNTVAMVARTQRWMKRRGVTKTTLMSYNHIMIPVLQNFHWSLLVVTPQEHKLEHLDSMTSTDHRNLFAIVRGWLEVEMGDQYHEDEWKETFGKASQQVNITDCGVLMCLNALAKSRGLDASHIQVDNGMVTARIFMLSVLLQGGFFGPFAITTS